MNLYKTLNINKNATPEQIKKSYRSLAESLHPDKGGDPEQFKTLSHAYSILSDPEKRKKYDATGGEDSVSTVESKANGLIVDLFKKTVIRYGVKVFEIDMISEVTEAVNYNIGKMEKDKETLNDNKRMLKKIMSKIRHKDKQNILSLSIQHDIDVEDAKIVAINGQLEIGKIAKKILKGYKFDCEEEIEITASLPHWWVGATKPCEG